MMEFFEKLLMGCYTEMQNLFRTQPNSLASVNMLAVVSELAVAYGAITTASQPQIT